MWFCIIIVSDWIHTREHESWRFSALLWMIDYISLFSFSSSPLATTDSFASLSSLLFLSFVVLLLLISSHSSLNFLLAVVSRHLQLPTSVHSLNSIIWSKNIQKKTRILRSGVWRIRLPEDIILQTKIIKKKVDLCRTRRDSALRIGKALEIEKRTWEIRTWKESSTGHNCFQ